MPDDQLRLLQSADARQRRMAIIALANQRDPAALPALDRLQQDDPEPELRALAQKAARYIRQYPRPGADAGNRAEAADHAAETGPAVQDTPPAASEPAITARDRELARRHLDAASGYYVNQQRGRAIENLGKALTLNPELRHDAFATNLITQLTGRPVEAAMPLLINPDARARLIADVGGRQPLRPVTAAPEDSVTWGAAILDLAIYGVVTAIVSLALLMLMIDPLIEMYEEALASGSVMTTTSNITLEDLRMLRDASLLVLVPSVMVSAIYSVIGLALQAAGIHFAAITFFGGSSTLPRFLHRYATFQAAVVLGYGVLLALALLSGSLSTFVLVAAMVGGLASLVIAYYVTSLIAQTYGIGWMSGCLSIILGGIFIAIVSYLGMLIFFGMVDLLISAI